MSAIAEWYILPANRIPELTAVCQPVKRSMFRAAARDYDAFWQFLHTHARLRYLQEGIGKLSPGSVLLFSIG